MTRQQLMEEVYKKNTFCSAGDIALALSKRFGRCQGNRKLADGTITKSHIEMGADFLAQKKQERQSQVTLKYNKVYETSVAFNEFCRKAHVWAEEAAQELAKAFKAELRETSGMYN